MNGYEFRGFKKGLTEDDLERLWVIFYCLGMDAAVEGNFKMAMLYRAERVRTSSKLVAIKTGRSS